MPPQHPRSRATPTVTNQKRILGFAKGMGSVPNSFFDPLPKDLEALYNGEEPEK